MQKNITWLLDSDRDEIIKSLQAGNVLLGTSDTVLGLLSDTQINCKSILNEIKNRDKKPYIILIESKAKAAHFVEASELVPYEKLMASFWPGPLTLIFKGKESLSSHLKAENGTVSLRVPKHAGLLSVLSHFDGLFSTSANKSGEPVPFKLEAVDPDILAQVSLIIEEGQGKPQSPPSTILDLTGSTLKIIREGAISKAQIEEVLGNSIE